MSNFPEHLKSSAIVKNCVWVGILNATPDSFSDGGSFQTVELATKQALKLEHNGACWIDVGGASTKPGSVLPTAQEELSRVVPVLKSLRKHLNSNTKISLDTMRASVALTCCEQNLIDIVNDVCSGEYCEITDSKKYVSVQTIENWKLSTATVAAKFKKDFVCMHMKSVPQQMQNEPNYEDVVTEVSNYLSIKSDQLKSLGIQTVWIDPGIGFGKTLFHNLALLSPTAFATYQKIDAKILIGLSRKSFLKKMFVENGGSEEEWLEKRDFESKVWEYRCLELGAQALRSHCVGF